MKKIIKKINENQLRQIVTESVKRILNEKGGLYDRDIDDILTNIALEVISDIHHVDPRDVDIVDEYGDEYEAAYRAAKMGYNYGKTGKAPTNWVDILHNRSEEGPYFEPSY